MLTKSEIIDILKDDSQNEALFLKADKIRQKNVGNEIHLRGLIEFSNICASSCKYCGLRAQNKNVQRYRMTPDEIIQCAKNAVDIGYKTIVLQSGEDKFFTREILCKIISEIKKSDTALTLSIGERPKDDYKAFKDAGADRYLIRIETTDKNLYKKMHPNMDFDNRLRCLYNLKELGYETGTGCLVGLPGQTIDSLADDILFFKNFEADMVGIGPFIPHPDTPLKDASYGDLTLALKVMALVRLLLRNVNIPATTAMETIRQDGRIIALQSGANVIMPNVTKFEYKKKYEIYPGKTCEDTCYYSDLNERLILEKKDIEEKIKSIKRTISVTKGFRERR